MEQEIEDNIKKQKQKNDLDCTWANLKSASTRLDTGRALRGLELRNLSISKFQAKPVIVSCGRYIPGMLRI